MGWGEVVHEDSAAVELRLIVVVTTKSTLRCHVASDRIGGPVGFYRGFDANGQLDLAVRSERHMDGKPLPHTSQSVSQIDPVQVDPRTCDGTLQRGTAS